MLLNSFLCLVALSGIYSTSTNATSESVIEQSLASAFQYKFMASLQKDDKHFCGGSLIDRRTILTAAHCSEGDPKENSVVLHRYNLAKTSQEENGIRLKVSKMVPHEKYNNETLQNDIAVWHLKDTVPNNVDISFIELARNPINEDKSLPEFTAIGWGLIEYASDTLPNELQMAKLDWLDTKACSKRWGHELDITSLENNIICTLSPNGTQSICNGDSGGPLFYSKVGKDGKENYVQVGLVSFGEEVCDLSKELPDGFTRVASYADWIDVHRLSDTRKKILKAKAFFKKYVRIFSSN